MCEATPTSDIEKFIGHIYRQKKLTSPLEIFGDVCCQNSIIIKICSRYLREAQILYNYKLMLDEHRDVDRAAVQQKASRQ